MGSNMTKKDVSAAVNEYKCFRKSGLLLSSHLKRMIDQYPEKWIAIYDGRVEAFGHDYDAVLSEIDKKGIPRRLSIIRYITKKPKSMIL